MSHYIVIIHGDKGGYFTYTTSDCGNMSPNVILTELYHTINFFCFGGEMVKNYSFPFFVPID
jgi:hypothetical protein